MSSASKLSFDSISGQSLEIQEQDKGKLGQVSVVAINNNSFSKKWYTLAILVGSLVVIGVGGFGTVGLLQSHGIISLPQSLQWLTSVIGTIGHTPHLWSLWLVAGGGFVIGGGLIAFGIHGVKTTSSTSVNLDGVPQSSDRAHRITWTLQAPFNFCIRTAISIIYPLQGSTGHKILEIVKRIFKAIAIMLLFIPASLLYGLGAISSRISDTPRIDTSMLHVAPPHAEAPAENLGYDLEILQNWFDEEYPSGKYRTAFNSMITNIKERNQALINAHKELPESFYDDMTLYLENIIDHLQRDPERRKDVLGALAEAADVCPPTWYEAAKKQLHLLVSPNVGEVQLLHWIQDIKEEIILLFAQNTFNSQWHALNYARFHAGPELGLNMEGLKNDQYFSRTEDSKFTKGFMITLFKAHFHADNLITALQMKVNESYRVCFFNMLKEAMETRGVKNATDYIAENFYEDDYITMNRNGVIMLLRIIGYLK